MHNAGLATNLGHPPGIHREEAGNRKHLIQNYPTPNFQQEAQ
jgi:hypothetical protein